MIGYYDERNILPCDSILGACFYTLSCIVIPLMCFFFFWIIARFVDLANTQLVKSRWYESVHNVCMKYLLEREAYNNEFKPWERMMLALRIELRSQLGYLQDVLYMLLYVVISLVFRSIQLLVIPIMIVLAPFVYFGKRILLLCCNIQTDVVHGGRSSKLSVDVIIQKTVDGTVDRAKRVQAFLKRSRKRMLKVLSRSDFVSGFRVVCYKIMRFVTCSTPAPSGRRRGGQVAPSGESTFSQHHGVV